MPNRFAIYLVGALVLLLAGAVYLLDAPASQDRPEETPTARTLDSILDSSVRRTATPGAQAAVMRDGEVLWTGTSGQSRIGSKGQEELPLGPETLFSYASFGKQILAAYTLLLVEQGKLDLDLPIAEYLSDSLPGAETVTTRMLLNHSAGYPDLYSVKEIRDLFENDYDPDRRWTFGRLRPGIREPDPGQAWQYSNTGYIVLLHLLESLTPEPLSEEFAGFLSPAGISPDSGSSVMTIEQNRAAAERFAHAYYGAADVSQFEDSFEGASQVPTDIYGPPFGDGLFAGTALAAARFLNALFVGKGLLDERTIDQMTMPAAGSGGYGLGSLKSRSAGATWQGHDGSYGGFTTAGFTDLERGLTIFVAANKDDDRFDPAAVIWRALARAFDDSGETPTGEPEVDR
jgi:CubicO group peptidase (beta-lactamase class C family)